MNNVFFLFNFKEWLFFFFFLIKKGENGIVNKIDNIKYILEKIKIL